MDFDAGPQTELRLAARPGFDPRFLRIGIDDDAIRETIPRDYSQFGFATCPHTATASYTWRELDTDTRRLSDWILVATAHPAKFPDAVKQATGQAPPVPPRLAAMLDRPERYEVIENDAAAVRDYIRSHRRA